MKNRTAAALALVLATILMTGGTALAEAPASESEESEYIDWIGSGISSLENSAD